ncbi:MAG: hypothetical protein ACOCWO_04095 [Candidatus Muiribacteriaceae bacterium]
MANGRFLIITAALIILLFLSGFVHISKAYTDKRALVLYPFTDGNTGYKEMHDSFVNFFEEKLTSRNIASSSRYDIDLFMQKNSIEPGDPIKSDDFIRIGRESGSDIVITTQINEYRANRKIKAGFALIEPITLNTSIIDTVDLTIDFWDCKSGEKVFSHSRRKVNRDRLLGLFRKKRRLLHRTTRDIIGKTFYLAGKKGII